MTSSWRPILFFLYFGCSYVFGRAVSDFLVLESLLGAGLVYRTGQLAVDHWVADKSWMTVPYTFRTITNRIFCKSSGELVDVEKV